MKILIDDEYLDSAGNFNIILDEYSQDEVVSKLDGEVTESNNYYNEDNNYYETSNNNEFNVEIQYLEDEAIRSNKDDNNTITDNIDDINININDINSAYNNDSNIAYDNDINSAYDNDINSAYDNDINSAYDNDINNDYDNYHNNSHTDKVNDKYNEYDKFCHIQGINYNYEDDSSYDEPLDNNYKESSNLNFEKEISESEYSNYNYDEELNSEDGSKPINEEENFFEKFYNEKYKEENSSVNDMNIYKEDDETEDLLNNNNIDSKNHYFDDYREPNINYYNNDGQDAYGSKCDESNKVTKGKIKVSVKLGDENGIVIKSAKINLYELNGVSPKLYASKLTDCNGEVIFENLENGCYRVISLVDRRFFEKPLYTTWNEVTIDKHYKEASVCVVNRVKPSCLKR